MAAVLIASLLIGCDTSDSTTTPTADKVPVSLALCVSPSQQSASATTRQKVDVVQGQNTPVYRDIQNLKLIPYSADGNVLPFSMPDLERQGTNYYNYLTSTNPEVSIGTKVFFAFARAKYPDGTTPDESSFKFSNGSTVETIPVDQKLSDITFDLEPICDPADAKSKSKYDVAEKMAKYLTDIAKVSGFDNCGTLYADFTNSDPSDATKNGMPIAGSTANVKKWVELLYSEVSALPKENALKAPLQTAIGTIESHFEDGPYPANIGLPDGAAALQWVTQAPAEATSEESGTYPKFVVLKASDSGTPMSDHSRFTYPSELFYYTLSGVMTSKNSQASLFPSNSWTEVLNHYSDGDVVSTLTRSVAIENPLDYGACCLELTFKPETATLQDNSEANEQPVKNIDLAAHQFPLKGIMISGQYQQVYQPVDDTHLYSFVPTTASGTAEHIIYDKTIPDGIQLAADATGPITSGPVYSLVLQSRDEKPVDIVLEFENNSGDWFAGYQGGIIYPGTRFYLIGQAWPSTVGNDEDKKRRVFTQDHKTTLQLTIQSLKNAYNVIPELRTAAHSIKVAHVGVKSWTNTETQDHSIYNW